MNMITKRLLSFYFFIFVFDNTNSQEIPFGSPEYFNSTINLKPILISFENEYTFSDMDQANISKTISGQNLIQYIYLDFDKVSAIQFKIDIDNFPSTGELFFIDPSINGWVGPYRSELIKNHQTGLTGQIRSSQVIIEWSSSIDELSEIPVLSIIRITEPNF